MEQQLINVLNLAKYNQLEHLQWKVEYLANEVNMLEEEKKKCTNDIEILNNRRDEYMRAEYIHESHPPQLRKEIYYMENQSRLPRLDNMKRGLTSTYIEDYIYLDPEDRSIEPVSSTMPLARSDSSSKLI